MEPNFHRRPSRRQVEQTEEGRTADDADADADAEAAEREAWAERTAVITKYEHERLQHLAHQFVLEVADQAVEQATQQAEPPQVKTPLGFASV